MNPYSDEELGALRREVMMRIAPTSDELQRVYEYGVYEAPRLNIPQQTMEQLEKMGILNAIRTMQGSMDKWDATLGNVSPYSVMNRARLPEPYRSQGLDWDAVQENMPGFGPADMGLIGWTAFHGTPHKWAAEAQYPAGRPRLDKVGAGEGAAAYGHGFYAADSKGVGGDYQKRLSLSETWYDDVVAGIADTADDVLYEVGPSGKWKLRDTLPTSKEIKEYLLEMADLTLNSVESKGAENVARILESKIQNMPEDKLSIMGNRVHFDGVPISDYLAKDKGTLYAIDIPDDVAPKLLDWDKPLSEQSEEVKRALQGIDPSIMTSRMGFTDATGTAYYGPPRDGASLYDALSRRLGGTRMIGSGDKQWGPVPISNDQAASEYLASIGIPGNKYFDAMSRDKGQGTYNYVIWDQDVLNRTVPLSINDQPTGLKPGDYPLSTQDVLSQLQP